MRLKRNNKDENLRPLKGWVKFLHRLGRLLLFPLRRPLITLLVLLILFLAPTFRGVKPITVPQWYASQIVKAYNKVLVWWGSRQPEVTPGEFKFHPEEAAPAPVVPSEFPMPTEPQDTNAPNILDVLRGEDEKESSEKSQTESQPQVQSQEEVKEQPELEPLVDIKNEKAMDFDKELKSQKKINIPKDDSLYDYPKDKKVYGLKYLDFPHEIIGKAKVYNNNEIEVNGEFILIYGVYVHPFTVQGERATEYLKDMIENKTVTCGVIAYTEQNVATGICYFNGVNINQDMIQKGYTKNIAL